MNILDLLTSVAYNASQKIPPPELMTRLEGQQTLLAQVTYGGQPARLILATRFGNLEGLNNPGFKDGDTVRIRLDNSGSTPLLKVTPVESQVVSIKTSEHSALAAKLSIDFPQLARVVQSNRADSAIRLNNQVFTLDVAIELKHETPVLVQKHRTLDRISILPTSTRQILKSVMTGILPRVSTAPAGGSITTLVDMLHTGLREAISAAKITPTSQPQGNQNSSPQWNNPAPAVARPVARNGMLTRTISATLSGLAPGTANSPSGSPIAAISAAAEFYPPRGADRSQKSTVETAAGSMLQVGAKPLNADARKTLDFSGLAQVAAAKKPRTPATSSTVAAAAGVIAAPTTGTRHTGAAPSPFPAHVNSVNALSHLFSPSQRELPVTKTPAVSLPELPNRLLALLEQFPRLQSIRGDDIRNWLTDLGIARASNEYKGNRISNLLSFVDELANDEALLREFNRLIKSATKESGGRPASTLNAHYEQELQWLGKELIRLSEQTGNQQLLQRTQLRYQQETQQTAGLQLNLPVIDQDQVNPLRLSIRQSRSSASQQESGWDIHLSFNFAGLDKIDSHIYLEGHQLSVSFWAINPHTKHKIDAQVDYFRTQLANAGFELAQINSFLGEEPGRADVGELDLPAGLVDIKV